MSHSKEIVSAGMKKMSAYLELRAELPVPALTVAEASVITKLEREHREFGREVFRYEERGRVNEFNKLVHQVTTAPDLETMHNAALKLAVFSSDVSRIVPGGSAIGTKLADHMVYGLRRLAIAKTMEAARFLDPIIDRWLEVARQHASRVDDFCCEDFGLDMTSLRQSAAQTVGKLRYAKELVAKCLQGDIRDRDITPERMASHPFNYRYEETVAVEPLAVEQPVTPERA